ncbi:MAG: 2-dehydropantoate 2-reductase [Rhizobium sp.]
MTVLIWGAGAMGGSLGAGLIRAGHGVAFVDNVPEHVAAINESGLKIVGPIFQDTVRAKAYLPEEVEGHFDCILLSVKAQHTDVATRALAPHLTDDGYVVSVQNGLNELVIKDIIGAERTIGCFVNFGADYLEPGVVQYSGRGAVVVGELDGSRSKRVAALHRLLLDFEANAVLTENIWGYLWGKLIYGAQLFATALTNDGIADCYANPAFRPVLTALGQEVGAVARANGVETQAFNGFDPHAFAPGASQELIDQSLDDMVAFNRRSAKSHSGIWRDLAIRKRRTEVKPQLGPIVNTGLKIGIPTPMTARLIDMIIEMEDGKRGFSAENMAELANAAKAA